MKRIKQGFELLRQSWSVLKADPEMIVVGVIGTLLFVAIMVGFYAVGLPRPAAADNPLQRLLALIPMAVVMSVFGTLVSATMVSAGCIRLGGGDPTIRQSLAVVARKLPKLLGWSLFAATIGVLIRLASERLPFAARFVTLLGGVAFQLAAVLVVPVLLFEDRTVPGSLKRSAELFKERWGEEATAFGGIGLATLVVFFPIVFVGMIVMMLSPIVGVIVIGLGILALLGTSISLSGVFTAVLYRYATAGEAPAGFSESAIQGSFPKSATKKKIRRWFRRS